MILVEVVPVHLIDSDCKYLLVIRIYSFLEKIVVEAFVDVDASGMSVVENKGMSQRFRSSIKGLMTGNDLKELFVKRVSLNKVTFDGLFEGWMVFD